MKKGEQNHRRESQKYEHEIKIEPKDETGEEEAMGLVEQGPRWE